MNKTTEALKLAEEALVEYRDNQHIKAPRKTLAAIRAALAELNSPDWLYDPTTGKPITDHIADTGNMVAEPVKQEPIGDMASAWFKKCCQLQGELNALKRAQPVKQEPVLAPFTKEQVERYATAFDKAFSDAGLKQEPVARMYCPECGSLDVRYEDGNHKQCASCAQEWFSDVDYSDVVQQNLNRLHAAPVDAKAIRAEALEEAAKVCEEQPRHSGDATTFYVATGQCAAAIRARGETK